MMNALQWTINLKPRSKIDNILEFIPIIGPMLAPINRQWAPTVEEIKEQLLGREIPTASTWGVDPLRVSIGNRIGRLIQEEYEWPNDHFIPDDPLDVVFLMPWDDLEIFV